MLPPLSHRPDSLHARVRDHGRLEEALARRLYVSNIAGDDTANGRYPESSDIGGPVRSISRALAACQVRAIAS